MAVVLKHDHKHHHMEKEPWQLGDESTSDTIIHLRNEYGKPEIFRCHSSILAQKSVFFAKKLPPAQSNKCIDISCSDDYDLYVKLLNLLYVPEDSVLESLESVKSAIGLVRVSAHLECEGITVRCIEYLEGMPWEEKEEEEILGMAQSIGPLASPLLARLQPPADLSSTRKVLISAIRFATSVDEGSPALKGELKSCAQEQVEYMLTEDEDAPLVVADEEVRAEAKAGLEKVLDIFTVNLNSLAPHSDHGVLQSISDLDWMCSLLSKMELMPDFVTGFVNVSDHLVTTIQDDRFGCGLWAVKYRIVELVGKAFDAIAFGTVLLPPLSRVRFLNIWLPFFRTIKPILDSKCQEDDHFPYKMDAHLCQNIEGAIVSLVLALPSTDQADILNEWMKLNRDIHFPNLTEAFEIWCYRAKAAKRRLVLDYTVGATNPALRL